MPGAECEETEGSPAATGLPASLDPGSRRLVYGSPSTE